MDITTQKTDKISCLFIHKYKNLFVSGAESVPCRPCTSRIINFTNLNKFIYGARAVIEEHISRTIIEFILFQSKIFVITLKTFIQNHGCERRPVHGIL